LPIGPEIVIFERKPDEEEEKSNGKSFKKK